MGRDSFVRDLRRYFRDRRKLRKWIAEGKPVPPPHVVKRMAVREYARKYGTAILIESGTYNGDMPYAARSWFRDIYSIELSDHYAQKAGERLQRWSNIHILRGDSGEVLAAIIAKINEPCLFWLDGHYSGGKTVKASLETPIIKEIDFIAAHPIKNHVMLVDDARDFCGGNGYPTVAEFERLACERFPEHSFETQDDIIRIAPA